RIVDLAQIQHVTLHTRPPLTRRFSTMLKVRCSLPSFRRIFARRNMTADNYPHFPNQENSLGRHYSRFANLTSAISMLCVPKNPQPPIEWVKFGYCPRRLAAQFPTQ